jgi:predicted dehydrogenase
MAGALRIVIVGCGGISDLWFKALQSAADASVFGLVDLREAAAAKRKADYQLSSARTESVGRSPGESDRALAPDAALGPSTAARRYALRRRMLRSPSLRMTEF